MSPSIPTLDCRQSGIAIAQLIVSMELGSIQTRRAGPLHIFA